MSFQAELELRIAAMPWQEFERLVHDLIEADRPDAIKTKAPDHGADVLLPVTSAGRAEVIQVKHYPGDIDWDACVESLSACLSYSPWRVTFVFAQDLTGRKLETFNRRLCKPFEHVLVDFWGLSKLRTMLQRQPAIRVRYFNHDAQTLADAMVTGHQQATSMVERALSLAGRDEDGEFVYSTAVGDGATLQPPVGVSHIAMRIARGGEKVEMLAVPADGRSGPDASWGFTDDETGVAARDAAILEVARGAHEVVITEGIRVHIDNMPGRMAEVVDEATDLGAEFSPTLRFEPGPALHLTVTTIKEGTSTEHTFDVRPFPPQEGADAFYVGLDGAVIIWLGFRLPGGRVEMSFTPGLQLTTDAATNERACSFVASVFASDMVDFAGDLFPGGSQQMPVAAFGDIAGHLASVEFLQQVYAEIVYVETEIGVSIPVHSPPFSDVELADLAGSVDLLRSRQGSGTFSEMAFTVTPDQVQTVTTAMASQCEISVPIDRSILGHPVRLGRARSRMPPVRIVELPSLATLATPMVTLKIYPDGDGRMELSMLGRDETVPPDVMELNMPAPGAAGRLWTPPLAS